MAKVNCCLKRTFIVFNVLFAIIGGVIIGLALLSEFININGKDGSGVDRADHTGLYILGSITMVIAILGAYGAHKESRVALIIFLVCMVMGSLLMLRGGVAAAIARPQIGDIMENEFRQLLPLDDAPIEVKEMADSVQTKLQCCGLFSYKDWGQNIPESCLCDEEMETEGECQMTSAAIGYRSFLLQQKSVYSKPCVPILMYYILLGADILIGVIFALAVLALLGMILSSIIIHQMRHPDRPAVLLTVPAIFNSPPKYQELQNPPKYQELQNPPEYQEQETPSKC